MKSNPEHTRRMPRGHLTAPKRKPALIRPGDRVGIVLSLLAAIMTSALFGWVSVQADRQIAAVLRADR